MKARAQTNPWGLAVPGDGAMSSLRVPALLVGCLGPLLLVLILGGGWPYAWDPETGTYWVLSPRMRGMSETYAFPVRPTTWWLLVALILGLIGSVFGVFVAGFTGLCGGATQAKWFVNRAKYPRAQRILERAFATAILVWILGMVGVFISGALFGRTLFPPPSLYASGWNGSRPPPGAIHFPIPRNRPY